MLTKQLFGFLMVGLSALSLLAVQALLVEQWRMIHEERERQARIKVEVLRLERLVADVDNGFRGYVLMKQAPFLGPMVSAEGTIPGVVERLGEMTEPWPELQGRIHIIRDRVTELLDTKRRLTLDLERGREEEVLAYIRGGEGLALSKTIALAFQDLDQRLERRRRNDKAGQDNDWVRWGLTTTATVGFVWGIGLGRAGHRLALSQPHPQGLRHRQDRLSPHPEERPRECV